MSREDFEGLKQLAKENHAKRIAQNPQRLKYACEQLKKNGIAFKVCNEETCQINVYTADGNVFTFYAGTGKIQGYEARGIKAFINLLTKGKVK